MVGEILAAEVSSAIAFRAMVKRVFLERMDRYRTDTVPEELMEQAKLLGRRQELLDLCDEFFPRG